MIYIGSLAGIIWQINKYAKTHTLNMRKMAILLLLTVAIASSANAQVTCTYKAGSCAAGAGEVSVLAVSAESNAHAGIPGSSYTNNICCTEITGVSTSCTDNKAIYVSLSSGSNAHAAFITDVGGNFSNGYANKICMQGTDIDCKLYTSGYPSSGCVITLSGTGSNAHVASCNSSSAYSARIYCSGGGGSGTYCGDGAINNLEQCDGTDLGEATCETEMGLGSTGSLSCTDLCTLDTSGCLVSGSAGNDVFSVNISSIGKGDLSQAWAAGNAEVRSVFEAIATGDKDEVAYVAVLRNLSADSADAKLKIELYDSTGALIEAVYNKTINIDPGRYSLYSYNPRTPFSGSPMIWDSLEKANYYFKITVDAAEGEEYIANNVSTGHFAVGTELEAVSVPETDLLLLPLIALIVLGILLHEQNKSKSNKYMKKQ